MPELEPLTGRWALPLAQSPADRRTLNDGNGCLSAYLRQAVDGAVRVLPHGTPGDGSRTNTVEIDAPSFLIVRQTLLSTRCQGPYRRWLLYGTLSFPLSEIGRTPAPNCLDAAPDLDCEPPCAGGLYCAQEPDDDSVRRYLVGLDAHNGYQDNPIVAVAPHLPGPFEDIVREIWSRDAGAEPPQIMAGRWDDETLIEVLPVCLDDDVQRLIGHFDRQEIIVVEDCSNFEAQHILAQASGRESMKCLAAVCVAGEFGLDLGWLNPVFQVPGSLTFETLQAELGSHLAVAQSCDSLERLQEAVQAHCHTGVPSFGVWEAASGHGHVMHPIDHDPLADDYEEAPATWRRCVPVLACRLLLRPVLHRLLADSASGTAPLGLAADLEEFSRLCSVPAHETGSRLGLLFCPTTTSAALGVLQGGHGGYQLPAQSLCIRPPVPAGLVHVPI
ncbi:MAG: hypothetical protein D8M59_00730 [Planctomycetes bacterium]|nr:hypothetical protein [Planctomycetota bacterium]NOG54753.1 hypothetical protein [Planctomycetota bacterium]